MKLVREHINEKFEENSDPVSDMGIGKNIVFDLEEIKVWYTTGLSQFQHSRILSSQEIIKLLKNQKKKILGFNKIGVPQKIKYVWVIGNKTEERGNICFLGDLPSRGFFFIKYRGEYYEIER